MAASRPPDSSSNGAQPRSLFSQPTSVTSIFSQPSIKAPQQGASFRSASSNSTQGPDGSGEKKAAGRIPRGLTTNTSELFGDNSANPSINLFAAPSSNPPSFSTVSGLDTEDDGHEGPNVPSFASSSLFTGSMDGAVHGRAREHAASRQADGYPSKRVSRGRAASHQQAASEDHPRALLPPIADSELPQIISNLTADAPVAEISEPGALITRTEETLSRLCEALADEGIEAQEAEEALSNAVKELDSLWDEVVPPPEDVRPFGMIGPGPAESDFSRAKLVGSLLLSLRHPPVNNDADTSATATRSRAPFQSLASAATSGQHAPLPRVLLSWLDKYCPAYVEITHALQDVRPNPTASSSFWTTVKYLTVRAQFSQAARLLEDADFSIARSALEDGYDRPGYHGKQLQNIQKVVNTAARVLRSSPATNGNWDTRGLEWSMYRKQIKDAIGELDTLVEASRHQSGVARHSARLGKPGSHGSGVSFTHAARMAETQLPLTIYDNLRTMYSIICGDVDAILDNAQDWLEATFALTVWWYGDDEDQHGSHQQTEQDGRDEYLARLACAVATATTEPQEAGTEAPFQLKTYDAVEVGLASLCQGDFEGVLRLLQYWSLPIAAAVVEIGVRGGWYQVQTSSPTLSGLDGEALALLDQSQPDRPLRKDDVVLNYAQALFSLDGIDDENTGVLDGWEVALEVLGRLEDPEVMKHHVSEMINEIPLQSAEQVDRTVVLCSELGFAEQGQRVSERYGDKVAETTDDYGTVLLCYARGRSQKKIKRVLDLLTAFCLVQSMAYPMTSDLDPQLRALLHEPETSFKAISDVDAEGAAMLRYYFSGYAAVRRFYEARDEGLAAPKGDQSQRQPLACKQAAAKTLVALVRNATASISSGVWDPKRESAVQIDGLMVLLGEALVFCKDTNRFFTIDEQYDILSAIEDLDTVRGQVYDRCEKCLQATLAHHRRFDAVHQAEDAADPAFSPSQSKFSFSLSTGSGAPARSFLAESISSEVPLDGFSLLSVEAPDVLELGDRTPPATAGGTAQVRREWDWRTGIPQGVRGADILKMLRLQLARGLSFAALS
ncbi:hypothetical protein KEM52_002083 [Ascosphaera acerosa]|nr:hypothetical protein KEM52_002083 [Ascosphaera acerosa]